MDFAFSEEQEMLRESARDFLDSSYPIDKVAKLADSDPGWDPDSWGRLHDLGWLGISVPAEAGGGGLSFLEEAVLFEETGRALFPGPFFSTVALALPLFLAGQGSDPDALAGIISGRRRASFAWAETESSRLLDGAGKVNCVARESGGWTLHGTKRFVTDLVLVDEVAVLARADAGLGVWRVDLGSAGASVVPRSTMDRTRRLGDLVLDAAPASLLVPPGEAGAAVAGVRLQALAALSCEAVGLAERALELTKEHVSQRQQFGRPIASYQGISHRVANMFVALELARSLAYRAAWCVATGDGQAVMACAEAKSAAAEAAVFCCEGAIQAMGGIGFTWEQPLHRFYKRAQAIDAFDGYGREHRADLAAALLDGEGVAEPEPALQPEEVPAG